MPRILQELKVFIASPSGLDEIRESFRDTLREFNDADIHSRTAVFTPIGWELTLGGYKRPQALINEDLEKCDYFILVLWDRWGSPPDNEGNYTSGCEEEFHLAVKCAEDPSRPMEDLIVFFKEVDEKQKADPGKQLKKVLNFRKRLERSKKHFFMTFQDKAAFQTQLRRFLTQWSRDRAESYSVHLALIEQGVKTWNNWRRTKPNVSPELARVDLRSQKLSGVDLRGANLYKADLTNADLIEANFAGANLTEANLSGANLYGADLTGANLSGTLFIRAHLRKCRMNEASFGGTVVADVDMRQVLGLETISHTKPSDIGINTLVRSKGEIPATFLRGCGLTPDFIRYIPSLLVEPIQFYSCFISYSHEDRAFARLLHERLQGFGVRCWLDEHQLLPGDDLHAAIDRGIRLWDKVLLCLSKASLTSWWVDGEINRAFQKESQILKERGKGVLALIPLNLDGFLFSGGYNSGKKAEIRSRVAADFVGWERDHKLFERELEKVVRALRTQDPRREEPPPSRL